MVLLVSLKNVILQPFSCVVLCFVGIWSILECISWRCSLFLATSSFFWSAPSFIVVLDVLYLLDYGFLEGFSPWSFGYLAYRFFHPHSIFLPWLSVFLFSCSISSYFFQYSGFFYHLISSYHFYLCYYLLSCPYFFLEHLYVFIIIHGVNMILSW